MEERHEMSADRPGFALNHMCAPQLSVFEFLDLARVLGAEGVEFRNDIEGNALADRTDPAEIGRAARERGLRILSINALQRFNAWDAVREQEAALEIGQAKACGAEALVLVPTNDGTGLATGERQANLRIALQALAPMLEEAGIVGLVEPLGFQRCSLRRKREAVEAIESLALSGTFRLVHDTFHHFVAGETEFFPKHTGLVHLSGVTNRALDTAVMRDADRVLVDEHDRLDNVGQIAVLRSGGYKGPLSFEPFSETVQQAKDLRNLLAQSMKLISEGVRRPAA